MVFVDALLVDAVSFFAMKIKFCSYNCSVFDIAVLEK